MAAEGARHALVCCHRIDQGIEPAGQRCGILGEENEILDIGGNEAGSQVAGPPVMEVVRCYLGHLHSVSGQDGMCGIGRARVDGEDLEAEP